MDSKREKNFSLTMIQENLVAEMQERGAFCLRVERNDDPMVWDVVFFLDMRLYCHVTIGPNIPEEIETILCLREKNRAMEIEKKDVLEVRRYTILLCERDDHSEMTRIPSNTILFDISHRKKRGGGRS